MQYIVWIPPSKQAECIQYIHQSTTPSKANIPAYQRNVKLLYLCLVPGILGTCASMWHCTTRNSKRNGEPNVNNLNIQE